MTKKILKKLVVAVLEPESKMILKKYKPKIVAVTGSVGKTSSKDAIAAVLSPHFRVRKSEKSFNSEIGIPLTIIGCKNAWSNPFMWLYNIFEGLSYILFPHRYPEWLVLEVGADRPGDIKHTTSWLKPDISVITYVGELPVHVEFFASPAQLAEEKSYLVGATKSTGLVVLNSDDPIVMTMANKAKCKVTTYGFHERSAVRASNYHVVYAGDVPEGITFKIDHDGSSIPIRVNGVLGTHLAYSVLAAFAVGSAQGLNAVTMIDALLSTATPAGRSRIIPGLKSTTLIDDTYNSSPAAVNGGLESLRSLKPSGRKIAVLGDMMELGKYTIESHQNCGKLVAEICDELFTVGQRAKFIADGAMNAGMKKDAIVYFDDSEEAGKALQAFMKPGDCILIKGSQYMRMEKTTLEVMAHPEDAEKLLVRQEKEWTKR